MFDIYRFLNDHQCIITVNSSYIHSNCPIHKGDSCTAFTWWLEKESFWCFTRRCGEGTKKNPRALVSLVYGVDQNAPKVEEILTKYTSTNSSISTSNSNSYNSGINNTQTVVSTVKPALYWCEEVATLGYTREFCLQHSIGGIKSRKGQIYAICFLIHDRNSNYLGHTSRLLEKFRLYLYNKNGMLPSKWRHSKGLKTSNVLYGENYLDKTIDKVVLTESPKDVCFLLQCGFKNVVGTFGLGLRAGQESLLISMGYTNLVYFYDNDVAGNEYYNSKNFSRINNLFNVKIATKLLKPDSDPDEMTKDELEVILDTI